MTDKTRQAAGRRVLICSCEKTMAPDSGAITAACGDVQRADQLCRADLGIFRDALAGGGPITIACTQEQPLFEEIAEEEGFSGNIAFANIRENAGWARDGTKAGPKMAALIAASAVTMPPVASVSMVSAGVALILGRDAVALDAARKLADHLDITVLLKEPDDVTPQRQTVFPVLKGTVRNATGHLGAFELTIDDYALPDPSSRARLSFGASQNGAQSECDIVIDLTGDRPLFPADELRDGYLRADPRDPVAVERIVFQASGLVGTFDKPRYVDFDPSICAHSRSKITGCTRCLDLCPTGAITPAGESVAIDPYICAGCGQCASVCPTGAAAYALPPVEALTARLRAAIKAYEKAGGSGPVLLFHDGEHGGDLIDALARFGDGLPADVVPVMVNEITRVGPEIIASAFAYGASACLFVAKSRPKHDLSGLTRLIAMTDTILVGLGYGEDRLALIETDDPDRLAEALADPGRRAQATPSRKSASFLPPADKRGLMEMAFGELHRVAPAPVDRITLDPGAPFGGIDVDIEACTLCLACVSACPADALSDHPDRPTLRFTESLCVQCGLCEATCPEDAIALAPRLDFPAWAEPRKLVKEEEPFTCISCAKPFGTRASVERVMAKLEHHWMFSGAEGENRRRVLQMCEDCRVSVVVQESFDPHETERPRVRTTDDYLREREQRKH